MKNKLALSILTLVCAVIYSSCDCCPPPKGSKGGGGSGESSSIDTNVNGGPSVTPTTVTFGVPSEACTGKGICKSAVPIQNPPEGDSSTNVSLLGISANAVGLRFQMASLTTNQPGQVHNFVNGVPISFDFPASLNTIAFAPAGYAAGSIIPAGVPGSVSVSSGTVVVQMQVKISRLVTTNVFFGSNAGGACNNGMPGICSISAAPVPPSAAGIGTVQVNFALKSDDASKIVMTLARTGLTSANQNQQVGLFTDGGTYTFTNPFVFDGSFAQMLLPANAQLNASTPGQVSVAGDIITVTFPYKTHP